MHVSAIFIRRSVATTLLTLAITVFGAVAFRLLPVSPLPQVDLAVAEPAVQFGARWRLAHCGIFTGSVPARRQYVHPCS